MSKFFATNAPNPQHWTLNSCFGAFPSVWVRLGLFLYRTKLDAKWAKLLQLMQKFVQQSRVIFFRNERSRSTLLDPKLLFRCVSFILGAFGTVSLLQEARCISLCHKVASEIYAMNGPDPPHWTLNLCFGAFLSIWVRLGPFCYYTKLSAKLVKLLQLMEKLLSQSRVKILRNRHS